VNVKRENIKSAIFGVILFTFGLMTLGLSCLSYSQNLPVTLKYNLGSTTAWAPFGYTGIHSKPGILVELIERVMKEANISTETSYLPVKRAVTALELGQIDFDIVSPDWFKDKLIGNDYMSSVPLFEVTEYFVTLPNLVAEFNQPEMAYGHLVGTVAGYAYFDDDKFNRADFLSENELIMGLVKGRFKVAIIEERAAQHWAKKNNVAIVFASVHTKGDIVIRLRKERGKLLPRINRAIKLLQKNGGFKKIFDKYH
jgi:ABC-type amino acid transport substrate-binding protein